ncbi:MAG: sodium-dependent transporter [Methanobrevibacter sp.]|nr:sodium-dependent transporter [Candidatus Methanovirga procula]
MDKSDIRWNNNFTFLISMIGSAVGLGNIWRYPYILYSNGGGSFLFVYLITILLFGVPFLLLEYSIGFKFKNSIPKIFGSINHRLEVIGWFIVLIPFMILTYYTTVIGWDAIYFILSFFKGWGADTNNFFSQSVLQSTDSIGGLTHIVLFCLISTLFVWFIIWFISHRDLNKGIGKVNKALIPLLFITMACIVIYSLTLKGALLGLTTLFTPKWSEISNPNIWIAAITQILFSLSIGVGVSTTYSSYISKNPKLTKNAIIVVCANCGFEFFTAIGIFSILGFMSATTGIGIHNLISEGTGLAFIVFPQVLNVFGDVAYIIGPIFFLCIFFAGVTSAISLLEPLISGMKEKSGLSRKKVTTCLVLVGTLISVIYTTGYGSYILSIVDQTLNQVFVIFCVILEAIIFSWFWGLDKIIRVLNINPATKIGKYWMLSMKYLLPFALICLWISGIYNILKTAGFMEQIVNLIILLIFIIVPFILTSFPSKSAENDNSELAKI